MSCSTYHNKVPASVRVDPAAGPQPFVTVSDGELHEKPQDLEQEEQEGGLHTGTSGFKEDSGRRWRDDTGDDGGSGPALVPLEGRVPPPAAREKTGFSVHLTFAHLATVVWIICTSLLKCTRGLHREKRLRSQFPRLSRPRSNICLFAPPVSRKLVKYLGRGGGGVHRNTHKPQLC